MSYAPSLVLSATDVDSELMFAPPASLISSIELECPPSPIRLATEDQLVPEPLLCTPSITLISPSLPSIPSLVSPSANDVKIASMPSSVSLTDFGCLPQHEHDLKSVFLPSPSAIEISLLSVLSTPAPLLPPLVLMSLSPLMHLPSTSSSLSFPGVVPVVRPFYYTAAVGHTTAAVRQHTRSDAPARTVIVILSKIGSITLLQTSVHRACSQDSAVFATPRSPPPPEKTVLTQYAPLPLSPDSLP
ncbi:hypothetical protein EDB85DRAFT_1898651 [Lactarius pseudohatsudake]|nr:hypothetical protein EDB85DRAFT_1898651 [Lactarius pseudohatsudake]